MHFHLPKPLHGSREFAGEVAVIVLGVAIALAAEQVVEEAHWHSATRQAVDSMREDALGERDALLARYSQRGCIERRLAEIGALFARHEAGQPIGQIGKIGRPFYHGGSAPSWQVAVADGSIAHLSFAQRRAFANAFDEYSTYERQMFEEKRVWQQLQMLNHAATFTPADWSQALQAFDLASDFEASFRITLPEYIHSFTPLGLRAAEPAAGTGNPFTAALCRPLLIPSRSHQVPPSSSGLGDRLHRRSTQSRRSTTRASRVLPCCHRVAVRARGRSLSSRIAEGPAGRTPVAAAC